MTNEGRLAGEVALVTGAARGIGRAAGGPVRRRGRARRRGRHRPGAAFVIDGGHLAGPWREDYANTGR
ncbi:hypothetical protein GCM10010182_77600 [Actinomadura cremea]|nr:hypothetical protein GCM10010182_77600 [Actinomadura cremea]